MTRKLSAYACAVLSTYLMATVLVSQFNIARVVAMGFPVSLPNRASAAVQDLVGMLGSYLPLIAIGFLIAFVFTALVLIRFCNKPALLYPLAAFVAVITTHLLMNMLLGVTGIAPVRSMLGLLSQGLAGAVGGYVYDRIAVE